MTEQEKKQGWFKKILAKYNKLCDELGVEMRRIRIKSLKKCDIHHTFRRYLVKM